MSLRSLHRRMGVLSSPPTTGSSTWQHTAPSWRGSRSYITFASTRILPDVCLSKRNLVNQKWRGTSSETMRGHISQMSYLLSLPQQVSHSSSSGTCMTKLESFVQNLCKTWPAQSHPTPGPFKRANQSKQWAHHQHWTPSQACQALWPMSPDRTQS